MADRTSAYLFGTIFSELADAKKDPGSFEPDTFARVVWGLMEDGGYDFCHYQMGADAALTELGLRHEQPGVVDEWGDQVVKYGPKES